MRLIVCVKNLKMTLRTLSPFKATLGSSIGEIVLKVPLKAYIGYIVD